MSPLHHGQPMEEHRSQVKIQTKHGYVHVYGSKIPESKSTAEIHKMKKRELTVVSDSLHYSVLKYSPCRERKQVGIKLQLKVVMTVITKTHERLPEETLEPISWTENHEEPGHREKDRWRHRSNSTISQVQLVQGLWSTDWEREEWAEGQKITEGF